MATFLWFDLAGVTIAYLRFIPWEDGSLLSNQKVFVIAQNLKNILGHFMRPLGDTRICGGVIYDGAYRWSFIEQERFRFIWLSVNAATTKIDIFTQFPSTFRFSTQQRKTEFARVLMWTVIAKGYLEHMNRPRPRTGSSGCPVLRGRLYVRGETEASTYYTCWDRTLSFQRL